MLLTGTFPRVIDEKQRIAIPKRLRDAFKTDDGPEVLFLAPGTDESLLIYTEASFSRLADQLAASSPTGQDVRAFSRLFFSQAERLELDRQGRMRVPAELVRHASLDKDAVLVGVRDHLELWDQSKWDAYVVHENEQFDQTAERAFRGP